VASTVPLISANRFLSGAADAAGLKQPGLGGTIPIRFELPSEGEVTLVIDDAQGKRVRNLISQTHFPKGKNTVWWDGTDDRLRDGDAANHGLYSIPARLVPPGTYTVRGLWHRPLELHYQMTVYSPGTPPWPTGDGSGGWMTNHTPASAVAFLPAGKSPAKKSLIYLGAWVGEGGSALSWIDMGGRKIGGRGWIGGAWTGAQYLAVDLGKSSDPKTYMYVASAWQDKDKAGRRLPAEVRLTKLTPGGDVPVLKPVFTFPYRPGDDPLLATELGGVALRDSVLGGMAVWNGLLVFTQTELNRVVFVDARQGVVLGASSLSSPRGVSFDSSGRLLVLSDKSLIRYKVDADSAALSDATTLVTGLEDPQGITVDDTGRIYVADQGNSNQVKVYSDGGRLVSTIGEAGPLAVGPYNPNHMNHPKALSVDSNGRVWVAENDFRPKRVSVWNSDGTLWRAYYGPPRYGGGGVIDSQDPTRLLYDGMEFQLDWQKRDYQLKRIYLRRNSVPFELGNNGALPETVIRMAGHEYLSNAFNSPATDGAGVAFLFLDRGDSGAVPVAAMGKAQEWSVLQQSQYYPLWPGGRPVDRQSGPAFFMWSDLNGDGKPEPTEITIRPGYTGGVTIGNDGSFFIANFAESTSVPGHALRIRPARFTQQNVPVYDDAHVEDLGASQRAYGDGGDQVIPGSDGWLVQLTAPPPFSNYDIGGSRNGIPMWSYPSLWPGLHASHVSPAPDRPGMLIGTTHVLGAVVNHPQAGPIFFVNGNMGDIYAFTQDGLFISQLFQDERQGKRWQMPVERPGEGLNELSLSSETFFPSATGVSDGKVYLVAGIVPAITEVDGLDTVKRIPNSTIQVTGQSLRDSQTYLLHTQSAQTTTESASKTLKVLVLPNELTLDGEPEHLHISDWASIDNRGTKAWFDADTKPYAVRSGVIVAGSSLIAAWETDDPELLVNTGVEKDSLFHTGGGLDLMLQTNPRADPLRATPVIGDERLFVTVVGGKTRAVLFVPVDPASREAQKVLFRSPWQTLSFDRVSDISGQVRLLSNGKGGYEVSLPLKAIGFFPEVGMRIKADIGLLRGSGGRTTQRVYWANKATAIVSDVPSEAVLTPSLWGVWDFER
jgi:hypothetical protein